MTLRPTHLLAVLLTALSGLLVGCDTETESLLGEFEARVAVEGLVRDSLEGEAVYTIVDTPYGPEFVLGLFVGSLYDSDFDAYDYILFRRTGERLSVGGYAVIEDPDSDRVVSATYANVADADNPRTARGTILHGTDGLLAITRVDPYGFMSGSFRFEGAGIPVGDPNLILEGEAQGIFEARYEPPHVLRSLGVDLDL